MPDRALLRQSCSWAAPDGSAAWLLAHTPVGYRLLLLVSCDWSTRSGCWSCVCMRFRTPTVSSTDNTRMSALFLPIWAEEVLVINLSLKVRWAVHLWVWRSPFTCAGLPLSVPAEAFASWVFWGVRPDCSVLRAWPPHQNCSRISPRRG